MNALTIPVSAGELIDKITILEIKQQKIKDQSKLQNIGNELALLNQAWRIGRFTQHKITDLKSALRDINLELWDIEDRIRVKEAREEFDDEFIALARSVYHKNDERARLKREVNTLVGSALTEEKSYADYRK